jgi:hypothetical protein
MAAPAKARASGARGLSADDLRAITDGLAAGRRPRVQFTDAAGQIAGQVGQVVSLLDPAAADEWVVVRFGRDELPFSPGDLRIAPKGAPARKAAAPPPPARVEPEFVIDKPVPVRPRPGVAATGPRAAATVDAVVPPVPEPAPSAPTAPAPAPRKASRPAKPKSPPGLTVTVTYDGGEWTVAAAQGSKSLAKPYVIKPAEALRLVSMVDVPGVQEAVEHIVSTERAEAEQQAERLRAELAEVEARLAELRDAG